MSVKILRVLARCIKSSFIGEAIITKPAAGLKQPDDASEFFQLLHNSLNSTAYPLKRTDLVWLFILNVVRNVPLSSDDFWVSLPHP